MKGLTEWNEAQQTWDPFIAVFHDAPDNIDLVSDVYMALWYDRHWTEAQANGTDWATFIQGGILKYRPRDGASWKVEDVENGGQMKTLLSYSSACLVCRDFGVVQKVLVGTHIYRCLVRRNRAVPPDVQSLIGDARVLHF